MDRARVDALIASMLETRNRISDLLFITGKPPLVEVEGRLTPFATEPPLLTPQFIDELADYIIGGDQRLINDFNTSGSCDCSYAIEELARFRVNIYRANRRRAIVMRKLQSTVPTLESLALRPVFREMIKEKNGIILVTGASGSGKTTTLAAIVNELNQTQEIHIVTLEDPIEFLHPHARAAISHRELGRDFRSFAEGLRAALRQAPKVVLVGEIRDRETMEIALTAAETGHLVLSTLHTINAGQTINRIIGFFSKDEEDQLRYRLSDTVRYVVSQRLVPKLDGSRLLISEVIGSSLRTRESIRYGESEGKTFHEIIDAGKNYGWHSFDHCLMEAFDANEVSDETVLLYCNDKGRVRRDLDFAQKRRAGHAADHSSAAPLKLQVHVTPQTFSTAGPLEAATVTPEAASNGGGAAKRRVIQPRAAGS